MKDGGDIKSIIKYIVIRIVRGAIKLARPFFKLDEKSILFFAYKRNGYGDNLKYVCEELLHSDCNIVWVTKNVESCDEIKSKGIRVIRPATLSYIFAQLKAKTVIYNDAIPPYMPKKKGQIYVNLWHGGMNFKHIGYDYLGDKSKIYFKKFALGNPQPDYYVSGSRFFTEDTAKSFRYDEKIFLPCGLPRNDILFDDKKKSATKERVKKLYGVEQKIVLFAPTFRNSYVSETHSLDFLALKTALSKRFGGEWIVFYRKHYFSKGNTEGDFIDCSDYADMQELLVSADVLISDYSSCMYDASFLKIPIFVYATDIDNYVNNERAFAYPIDKWPYPIAADNEELERNILTFDEQSYMLNTDRFLKDVGSYENADSSKTVARLILKTRTEK